MLREIAQYMPSLPQITNPLSGNSSKDIPSTEAVYTAIIVALFPYFEKDTKVAYLNPDRIYKIFRPTYTQSFAMYKEGANDNSLDIIAKGLLNYTTYWNPSELMTKNTDLYNTIIKLNSYVFEGLTVLINTIDISQDLSSLNKLKEIKTHIGKQREEKKTLGEQPIHLTLQYVLNQAQHPPEPGALSHEAVTINLFRTFATDKNIKFILEKFKELKIAKKSSNNLTDLINVINFTAKLSQTQMLDFFDKNKQ